MATILHPTKDQQLILYPTGAGEPKLLSADGLQSRQPRWLPDGKRIVFVVVEQGHGPRLYVRDVEGGNARPITPEGYRNLAAISTDSKRIIVRGPDRRYYLLALDGGEPTLVPGVALEDAIAGWTSDERFVYVRRGGRGVSASIERLDITTGRSEKWKELVPADRTGLIEVGLPIITPDGRSYAYSTARLVSELFLAEGMK